MGSSKGFTSLQARPWVICILPMMRYLSPAFMISNDVWLRLNGIVRGVLSNGDVVMSLQMPRSWGVCLEGITGPTNQHTD